MEMSSLAPLFIPFKKNGTGNFSERVEYCHQTFEKFESVILSEFDKLRPSPHQTFAIADYGTADGGASYSTIRQCVVNFKKKHGNEVQIQVIYEDQPINDFKPVFTRSNGLHAGSPGLTEFQNIFVLASGTSFYHQCVPDSSLDFILSSTATHWLSKCPVKTRDTIFPVLASLLEKDAYRKQAALDWENFLFHRSKELKPGGRMVLLTVNLNESSKQVMQYLSDLWKSLLQDGTITEKEFEDTNFSLQYRTIEELRKPFEDENSLVYQTDLKLVSEQTSTLPIVDKALDLPGDLSCNIKRRLDMFTESHRAFMEHVLYSALTDGRPEENKTFILDYFFKRLHSHVSTNLKFLEYNWDFTCLVIEK